MPVEVVIEPRSLDVAVGRGDGEETEQRGDHQRQVGGREVEGVAPLHRRRSIEQLRLELERPELEPRVVAALESDRRSSARPGRALFVDLQQLEGLRPAAREVAVGAAADAEAARDAERKKLAGEVLIAPANRQQHTRRTR